MNEEQQEAPPEFVIPNKFIDQLYEFSGGADRYKGIILAICSENGDPIVYSKFDSAIMEIGLKKAVRDFAEGKMKENENDL